MPKVTSKNRAQHLLDLKTFWDCYRSPILNYGSVPTRSVTGVAGNTYRAYGRFRPKKNGKSIGPKPGKLFLSWIQVSGVCKTLAQTKRFAAFHSTAVDSLVKYWKSETGKTLKPYPYAAKLIDLHFKHAAWHSLYEIGAVRRKKLMEELFQPLDKYSLRMLKACDVKLMEKSKIRSNASMGSIACKEEYLHLQGAINALCKEVGVPNFAFDQYAWNQSGDDEAQF